MDSRYSFEDVDFLLKRDWFMSSEDIEDLIWELHQHVFDRVLEHWLTYSHRIQDVLSPYIVREPKVKDITDAMMDRMWQDREDTMRKKWQDDLKNFVAPPRPASIFDERYDTLNIQIQKLRKEQPKTLRRKKQIEEEIQMLENEFEKVKERRTAQDNLWTELQWIESANRVIGRRT